MDSSVHSYDSFSQKELPPSPQALKRYGIRSVALLGFFTLVGVIITAFVIWIIGNSVYDTEETEFEKLTVPSPNKTYTAPLTSDLILPPFVYPINYDWVIKTYLPGFGYKENEGENKSLTFDAQVIIQLNITKAIRNITVDSLDLRFNESRCTFIVDGEPVGVRLEVNKDVEKVSFNLDKEVEPTDNAVLKIVYNGDFRTDMTGLYQTSYTDINGERKMVAVTQMEPFSARKVVPCFDEPAFKASWTVTVIHPTGTTAIANGIEEKSENLGDNFISSKFRTTPRMSTYLLAILVSKFEYNEKHTKSGVRFRVWSRPEEKNSTVYALEAGVKCLEFFENYYKIPFPLAKQDMVAVPDFAAGAMENWGLITYNEDSLLYDPRVYTGNKKRHIAMVIAHELAHQWFGNLVTLKWWNDLWLNEGFATLAQYLGTDEISAGNFRMNEWFTMDTLWTAFEADSVASTHPMTFQIDKAIEVLYSFDHITYQKGGSVLSMLRKTIGEDNFNTAINHYLNEHKYKNAEAADLFNAIADMLPDDVQGPNGAKLNITDFLEPWTKQLGYPLLSATRVNSSTIRVEQERFKMSKSELEEEKYRNPKWGFKWDVPVWYQSVGSKNIEMKWMKSNEPLYIHSEQPVILNADSNGFYRGGYSTELWQQIIKVMKEDHQQFSTKTRVRLIDDSFAGVNAGILNYSIPLELLMYLRNEQDYIPWSGALKRIRELDDKYGTVREKDSFHKFVLALSSKTPAKKYVDFVLKNYLDDKQFVEVSAAKELILNDCFMGDSGCGENMVKLFNKEVIGKCGSDRILSECSQIPAPFRADAYCQAVKNGNRDTFDKVFHWYKTERNQVEKLNLMNALGCSKDIVTLKKLMLDAMKKEGSAFRLEDCLSLFRKISTNAAASDSMLNFLIEKWDEMLESRLASNSRKFDGILSSILSTINTRGDFEKLRNFRTRVKSAEQYGIEYLEYPIEVAISWRETNQKFVTKYVEDLTKQLQN